MQCSSCGYAHQAQVRFCRNCGTRLIPLQDNEIVNGGAYRIIRRLGAGGMGAIYLAEDLAAAKRLQDLGNFQYFCVIKEMLDYVERQDYATDAEYQQAIQKARLRFEDEARTLATLKHPGIPRITDYFSEAKRNYIVMEYIEGDNLEQGLPHPQADVLKWGIELCRVLEYLAAQNPPVVHHDIKPANIILDRGTGAPRLVDFGTAKARLTAQAGSGVGMQKSSIYGTMGYAAPEMYPPNPYSEPRSDVYALAVTIYHLLTGNDPRQNPTLPHLGTLPAEVQRVLGRALEQDVTRRATAAELRQALETLTAPQAAQPFTFRSGEQARTPAELVPLCDKYWDEGRGYLYGGQFAGWLASLNRHDLLAKVDAARQRGGDRDAGLEEFLHVLDPNLPHPNLQIGAKSLDFGALAEGQTKTLPLTVRNVGRGYAVVNLRPMVKWLTMSRAAVSLRAGQSESVPATADAGKMPPGAARGAVEVGAVQIPAMARLSVWRTLWARYPAPITGAIAVMVVLVIVALYAGGRAWDTMSHYRAGMEHLNAGEWEQARGELAQVRDYKDAAELLQESYYRPGKVYFDAGQWEQARGELGQVRDYKDAAELLQESYYRPGMAYLDAGEWEQARGELAQVRGYKDANDKLRDILLQSVEMVHVPAGEFPMGSNDGDRDEKPVHTVYLDAYWIDKYEVTNAQYRECLEAGACREPRYWNDRDYNAPLQPVVGVDWEQARTYCEWAGKRLPTEAEWEKAARGTDGRKYPWGDAAPDCDKAQYGGCDGDTVVVGSKPAGASPYGAEDMAGNVWEWTADWYAGDYYASAPARNPTGPASGSAKVVRGGTWIDNAQYIRAADRCYGGPTNSGKYVGVRCAQDASP